MNENNIKTISTETLSVDFFKGERKIAVFTDGDYRELKQISGEYGVKRYSKNDEVTNTNSSLIVGIGEDDILNRAKEVALKENVNLVLIPTIPSITAFLPYVINKNCDIVYEAEGHTVLLIKQLLNNQPREKLSFGLGAIASVLISLVDQSFGYFLKEEELKAQKLLNVIKCFLKDCNKFSYPTQTIGFELTNTLCELSFLLSLDTICTPIITAYLFSLYKRENLSYNDYIFGVSFAYYSVINSYRVQSELIMPPDRVRNRASLRELIPDVNVWTSLEPKNFVLRSFILKDRYEEIIEAIKDFPKLAKSYLRLSGNSGFGLRNRYTAEELLRFLPLTCELTKGTSLLKHIYSTGILG